MTPVEQQIANTIRTLESLFDRETEREKIIEGAAHDTGASENDVTVVYDKLYPTSAPVPEPSPFIQRATPMIARGVPVIWIPPIEKKASLLGWQDQATTDREKVVEWGAAYPEANIACVAKAQPGGLFFLDIDKIGFEQDIQRLAGKQLPATFAVRTGKGGQHFYFRHTPETIRLAQEYGKSYISGKQDGKEAWSLRWNNAYVIGPLSVHPETKKLYEVVQDVDIAPGPEWLVEWCLNNHADDSKHEPTGKTNAAYINDGGDIVEGSRNNALTSILGKKRQDEGWDQEQLYAYGLEVNEKRVKPPLPESEVRTIARSVAKYPVVPKTPVVFDSYKKNPQQQADTGSASPPQDWRSQFRNLSEMEQGDIVMIIDGVLQEGTCFIGANPGHGKTLVALAFAKAISLGEPLFGIPEYTVKEPRNVIYLIPESGDKAFRGRGESFRLPKDDRFLARTISSGASLALSDPALMEAVRQKKAVVILDTASRFLQANDENSAAQNRLLVNDVLALRAAGAACVIILHHAKKSQGEKREAMTLDNMLRGTSDFGAMCDQAYGIRMDDHLYNRGAGPMEIELVNLKDRERLGGLTSIRLAASYRKPGAIFPASYIDETGDFRPVGYKETKARDEETLNSLVTANPMMTITELCEATGLRPHTVKETLKEFGWHMAKGGPEGHSPWHKDTSGVCPYKPGKKSAVRGQSQADVNFDAPARVN